MSNKFLNKGFSLIELMAVISILGILSAIALPTYQHFVEKANIANASTVLININQEIAEKKLQLLNGNFITIDDITKIIDYHKNNNNGSVSKKYTISAECDDSCLNYRIFAEPKSGNGLQKSVWLGSNVGLYICDLTSIASIKNASKNGKCNKQY